MPWYSSPIITNPIDGQIIMSLLLPSLTTSQVPSEGWNVDLLLYSTSVPWVAILQALNGAGDVIAQQYVSVETTNFWLKLPLHAAPSTTVRLITSGVVSGQIQGSMSFS